MVQRMHGIATFSIDVWKGERKSVMKNMDKLKLYTVIKARSNGMVETGDMVWLSENDDLNSCNGCGWLSKSE